MLFRISEREYIWGHPVSVLYYTLDLYVLTLSGNWNPFPMSAPSTWRAFHLSTVTGNDNGTNNSARVPGNSVTSAVGSWGSQGFIRSCLVSLCLRW